MSDPINVLLFENGEHASENEPFTVQSKFWRGLVEFAGGVPADLCPALILKAFYLT
jgi:hypothetical protein